MSNQQKKVLKAALSYAKRGWFVVPMYAADENGTCTCYRGKDCKNSGKHPATGNGGYKNATTDPVQIRKWFSNGVEYNVGVVTGDLSDLLVIDLDKKNHGYVSLKKCVETLGKLPKTLTTETGGGGKHFLFEHPNFTVVSNTDGKCFGRGIDVLGNARILTMPPSVHASGNRYTWQDGASPADLKPQPLPKKWLDKLRPSTRATPSKKVTGKHARGDGKGRISKGGRNSALIREAGKLRALGLEFDQILILLQAFNKENCDPPLSKKEVETVARNGSKYDIGEAGDIADKVAKDLLNRKRFGGGRRLLHISGSFWWYDGKVWVPLPDEKLKAWVYSFADRLGLAAKHRLKPLIDDVVALLRVQRQAGKKDPLRLCSDPKPVVNCLNGEVWFTGNGQIKLKPHRAESRLRHLTNVAYEPNAQCPRFRKALGEIFANAPDPDAMVRLMFDLIGYILQPTRNIAVILVFTGGGDNGKSTLVETIIRLLGKDVVVSDRIENLERDKFLLGNLMGKQLYVDDDMKAGIRLPDGPLKKISQRKLVFADKK